MSFPRTVRMSTVVALVGLVGILAVASPARAEGPVGYVRLAHLSPDTPKVDVYLSKVGDAAVAPQVFEHVGYGVMTNYMPLPVGTYGVAMRAEGAPATDPPVLTTQVTVTEGAAYTVAGVGRFAGLGLKVLSDDLSRPAANKAKVRVIQASVNAPVVDVELADGTPIAKGAMFASTTDYQVVSPGTWTLRLRPSGSSSTTTLGTDLAAGSVYSLLVLDGANGLTLQLRADARGGGSAPFGGVEAGGGGTSVWLRWPVIAGVALVLALAFFALRMRRVGPRPALASRSVVQARAAVPTARHYERPSYDPPNYDRPNYDPPTVTMAPVGRGSEPTVAMAPRGAASASDPDGATATLWIDRRK